MQGSFTIHDADPGGLGVHPRFRRGAQGRQMREHSGGGRWGDGQALRFWLGVPRGRDRHHALPGQPLLQGARNK